MEIVIVVLLIAILAALVFAWTKFRPGAAGSGRLARRGEGVRGSRRAAAAAHHDPMAEAVERHSMATDPHEAAEAELRLQAQANRVAADMHAQRASALESEAGGIGGADAPAYDHGTPAYGNATAPGYDNGAPGDPEGRRPVVDEHGRPVYVDGEPLYEDDRRTY